MLCYVAVGSRLSIINGTRYIGLMSVLVLVINTPDGGQCTAEECWVSHGRAECGHPWWQS